MRWLREREEDLEQGLHIAGIVMQRNVHQFDREILSS
jgi:hypothetical protein